MKLSAHLKTILEGRGFCLESQYAGGVTGSDIVFNVGYINNKISGAYLSSNCELFLRANL